MKNRNRLPVRTLAHPLVSLSVLSMAALVSLAPQTVCAQQPGTAASAQQGIAFHIPAQPLAHALNRFSQQSRYQVLFDQQVVAGYTAPAVQGSYLPRQALNLLLAGTGLQVNDSVPGAFTVLRASRSSSADGALPEVVVAASSGYAPGELPPAYAGGQVASGSRIGMLGNKDFMETPFATISYTDIYAQNRQARDLPSVVAATDPAVFSNGASGMIGESYSVRGFGASATVAGLHGVEPYYRTTPEMYERVEVLKGPSALLNGMPPGGSVGGSINLVPKRAGDTPLTQLTATYMSDAQFGGHIDVGRRFGENKELGIRVNGVYRDGEGAVNHQDKETNLASLAMDWRGESARFSADLYTSKDHVDGLNRGVSLASGLPVLRPPKPETLLNPTWTFTNTEDRAAVFRGEVDITNHLTAYTALGGSKVDFDALAASTYQVFNEAGDIRNNVSHQRSIISRRTGELGLRGTFQTGTIGHEWVMNTTHFRSTTKFGFLRNMWTEPWVTNIYAPVWGPSVDTSFSQEPLSKTGAVRMSSYGVADTLSFGEDRVQLTLGIRRQQVVSDSFDAASGARTSRYDANATTPAGALLIKISNTFSLYGNYVEGLSQGATAPASAANAGQVFPPYKTKQKEIGFKFDHGDFAHTFSLYQIERPSSYTDPVTNVYAFGGEQRNRGVEWSFFGMPYQGIRLMGGIGYLEPKLTQTSGGVNQGKLATGAPKLQAKLGAEWDITAIQGLTLTANASSATKQYINADNSLWVPGRTIYDIGARYTTAFGDQPLTLRATVQNVTNKAYWASTLSSGLGAPRTFLVSATVDF